MTQEYSDKRRGQRILTALPVFLKNAQGITRDVSASGVYFWISEASCAPGELIHFSVELRRRESKMVLKCQGDVVRMEPRNSVVGVAVKIIDSAMEQSNREDDRADRKISRSSNKYS
jgi:hypothetical protein